MTCHIPVLLEEVVTWIRPVAKSCIVDGTLGGGGHTEALCKLLPPTGILLAIDRDAVAIDKYRAAHPDSPIRLWQGSYSQIPEVLPTIGIVESDAILLDLGLSSDQLADRERGFSFMTGGLLDLRYDQSDGEPAYQLLQRIDEKSLADLIYNFGEERFSRRIARAIVEQRRTTPIRTANELRDLIHRTVPGGRHGRVDSATRTFQALRIAVNDELLHLQQALDRLPSCLRVGGRMLVISFHSLEDRMVKNAFRNDTRLQPLTKKPIIASESEIRVNPRARSAKLRVAERLASETFSR